MIPFELVEEEVNKVEPVIVKNNWIGKTLYPIHLNFLFFEYDSNLSEDEDKIGGHILFYCINDLIHHKSNLFYNSLAHPQSYEFNVQLVYLIDYICSQMKSYEGIERDFVITLLFFVKQIQNTKLNQCDLYASMVPLLPYQDCIQDFYERTLESKVIAKRCTKIFLGAALYFKSNPMIKISLLQNSPLLEIIRCYFDKLYKE
jgi:hypothetical protein